MKTLNSNSPSAKSISITGNSKVIIDIGQLRVRSCEKRSSQFSVSTLTTPLPPPLTVFFVEGHHTGMLYFAQLLLDSSSLQQMPRSLCKYFKIRAGLLFSPTYLLTSSITKENQKLSIKFDLKMVIIR